MYFIQRVICLFYEIITIYTPCISFQIIIIPYAPNLNNKYEKLTVDATLQQPWFYIFIYDMFAFADVYQRKRIIRLALRKVLAILILFLMVWSLNNGAYKRELVEALKKTTQLKKVQIRLLGDLDFFLGVQQTQESCLSFLSVEKIPNQNWFYMSSISGFETY